MLGANIKLKETDNGFEFLKEAVKQIENAHTYVGIPEEKNSRVIPQTKREIPTNAGLLFIHTHGSEVKNIPPRPVIEPAIEADKEGLVKYLRAATNAYLEGDIEKANKYMVMAGIRGANDAKRWFKNPANGWPRNKADTIKRKLEKALRNNPVKLKRALSILENAGNWGDVSKIDQTLVDYGEMKRAITYVTDLPTETENDDENSKSGSADQIANESEPGEVFGTDETGEAEIEAGEIS